MTPRGGTPHVSFRIGSLAPKLDERIRRIGPRTEGDSTRAQVAARDLRRYYAMLERGMEEVAALDLSLAEAYGVCVALQHADRTVAFDDKMPRRLANLSYAGMAALRDAVERFWLGHDPERNVAPVLELLGLWQPQRSTCNGGRAATPASAAAHEAAPVSD